MTAASPSRPAAAHDSRPSATVILEPDHNGHHLQSVSWVVRHQQAAGPVVLLTNTEAAGSQEFTAYIADDVAAGRLEVRGVFHTMTPPIAEQADVLVATCAELESTSPVGVALHMDADQSLKHWWRVAPRRLRTLSRRPRVVFMLTRYPARLRLDDWTGWRLRAPKAVLSVLARLTGSLDRVVGYAGRDDDARGWLVKRVQDPAFCTAHHRDKAQWRTELDLPRERLLAGIFGVIYERKNVPLLLDAIEAVDAEIDIVLAGAIRDDVRSWIDSLDPARRERLVVRDAYLSNEELDRYVAAMDVIPLALTNNGPSGIMGKAEAAGVPVVTAGSVVRARELQALGAGLACELEVQPLGHAMKAAAEGDIEIRTGHGDPWAAVDRYTDVLLGPGRR